uniref:hypothetical protein n=1 Tax=Prevotella sp. TaxID=59823 RepID=UPI0040264532
MLKHGADGKEVLAIARGKLMQSGMALASRLKKDITHNALNCTIIVIFCEKASQI